MRQVKFVLLSLLMAWTVCDEAKVVRILCTRLLTELKTIDEGFKKFFSQGDRAKGCRLSLQGINTVVTLIQGEELAAVTTQLTFDRERMSHAMILPPDETENKIEEFKRALTEMYEKQKLYLAKLNESGLGEILEKLKTSIEAKGLIIETESATASFVTLNVFNNAEIKQRVAQIILNRTSVNYILVKVTRHESFLEYLLNLTDENLDKTISTICSENFTAKEDIVFTVESLSEIIKASVAKMLADSNAARGIEYKVFPQEKVDELYKPVTNRLVFVLKSTNFGRKNFQVLLKFHLFPEGALGSVLFKMKSPHYQQEVVFEADSAFQFNLQTELANCEGFLKQLVLKTKKMMEPVETKLDFKKVTKIVKAAVEEKTKNKGFFAFLFSIFGDKLKVTEKYNRVEADFESDSDELKSIEDYKDLPILVRKGPVIVIINKASNKPQPTCLLQMKVEDPNIKKGFTSFEFPLTNQFDYTDDLKQFVINNLTTKQ